MRTPKKIATQVFTRDNHTCQDCGARPAAGPRIILHTHHKIAKRMGGATTIDNLITLCLRCHAKIHRGLENLYKKNKRLIKSDVIGDVYERCY